MGSDQDSLEMQGERDPGKLDEETGMGGLSQAE